MESLGAASITGENELRRFLSWCGRLDSRFMLLRLEFVVVVVLVPKIGSFDHLLGRNGTCLQLHLCRSFVYRPHPIYIAEFINSANPYT
jgi:hypothetical protein